MNKPFYCILSFVFLVYLFCLSSGTGKLPFQLPAVSIKSCYMPFPYHLVLFINAIYLLSDLKAMLLSVYTAQS